MSLIQFLRILWARRGVVLATTICTCLGALIAILIVPPRYEGVSRVMLNILKPDPVTGELIGGAGARTYIATQSEIIKDDEVAGRAVDALGWASSPDMIAAYQSGGDNNGMDIRRWLAKRVVAGTVVENVGGTNILEIRYQSSTPVAAKTMANALRDAYIETTLDTRRREAARTADWYEIQAEKERKLLTAADAAKTAFEKENDVVMQGDVDVDTARLRALAGQAGAPAAMAIPAMPVSSASGAQLAQLDATIAQASKNLGPNHPQMVQLRAQRATLAQGVGPERAASRAAAGAAASAASASAGALQREVAAQTTKVIQKRDKIERLNQLQAEVTMRREQYNKSMGRIAELRQEASVADAGVSTLAEALMPDKPKFPNKPLILGGALALGFGLGLLLSLLLELFGRRVRSVEDLRAALDVPLLAIIDGPPTAKRRLSLPNFGGGGKPRSNGRGKLAQA